MRKSTAKSDGIQNFEKRAQLIQTWRTKLSCFEKLAESWVYIRVRSKDYRPISIHPDNPCGRLIPIQRVKKTDKIEGFPDLSEAIRKIKDAEPPNFYKPGNAKPELRIQASLIRYALMNGLRLHGLFNDFSDVFDELIFVTDELRAGSIRPDIIALGGRQGRYFPVFIELKVDRKLKRVTEQLTNAKETMNNADGCFLNLLANATGKPKSDISIDNPKLFIIWSPSPSGKEDEDVTEVKANGFIVGEYDPSTQQTVRSR